MKKKIMVLFGGSSTEHEVSLISAKNVLENIDPNLFDVLPVGITQEGSWYLMPLVNYLDSDSSVETVKLKLRGAKPLGLNLINKEFFTLEQRNDTFVPDVIFPVLHGVNGEDGSVQGLAQILGIPVVGCGVLGSAICMDKEITKRLLAQAGIASADYVTLRKGERIDANAIVTKLGLPLFVKAANGGSSVGVTKAKTKADLPLAIEDSFKYDDKIIIEAAVVGRELEISVIGNLSPETSKVMGEIIPAKEEYYSYAAKYVDDKGVSLAAPAYVSPEILASAQEIAIKAFKCLECHGMARVDFFLQEDGSLLVNELNTIPGFTNISMYPKLFALSGVEYSDLITKLINLATETK